MPPKSARLRAALGLPASAIVIFGASEAPKDWKIQEFGRPALYWSPATVAAHLARQPRKPKGGHTHGTPGGKNVNRTMVAVWLDDQELVALDTERGDTPRGEAVRLGWQKAKI